MQVDTGVLKKISCLKSIQEKNLEVNFAAQKQLLTHTYVSSATSASTNERIVAFSSGRSGPRALMRARMMPCADARLPTKASACALNDDAPSVDALDRTRRGLSKSRSKPEAGDVRCPTGANL